MTTKTPYLSETNLAHQRFVKLDSNCKVKIVSPGTYDFNKMLLQEIQFYEPTPSVSLTEER